MKRLMMTLAALSALAATPALAGSDTHISFGFYAPAPVYYEPAPVVYYPPVRQVYYAPRPFYGHEAWKHRHHRRHHEGYATAWNQPYGEHRGYEREDNHGRGRHH